MQQFKKTNKMKKDIVARHWILKPRSKNVSVHNYKELLGKMQSAVDIGYTSDDVVVVGTEEQIREFFNKMFWKHAWQIRDSFNYELKDWYLEKYRENNNEVITINLQTW